MQNTEKRSSVFPVSSIFIALVAVSGYLLYKAPYESARPDQQKNIDTIEYGDENVHARLWQDPFQTVEAHKNTHHDAHKDKEKEGGEGKDSPAHPDADYKRVIHSLKHIQACIFDRLDRGQKVLLLPVMAHGGPYAEDKENRLRSRYAMVSALGNEGYEPENNEFIGYFEIDGWPSRPAWQLDENTGNDNSRVSIVPGKLSHTHDLTVPFEWFSKDLLSSKKKLKYDSVLVLWIKDDEFKDLPLMRLALFKERLTTEIVEGKKVKSKQVEMKVLGPVGSAGIMAMLRDVDHLPVQSSDGKESGEALIESDLEKIQSWLKEKLKEVTIFSPWSTMSEELIFESMGITRENDTNLQTMLDKKGVKFVSTICRDDKLAEILAAELRRRGVDLFRMDSGAQIILVNEWDTSYGKALPKTISMALTCNPSGVKIADEDLNDKIININYLRGLDGKAPGLTESGTPTSNADDGVSKNDSIRYPTGESQLDTMRKLAYWLKRQYSSPYEDKKVKKQAIGVIGSDVYDKLLMLQALRQIMPEALYFTTDFDTRLTHPDQYKWTRNLIIASGYGPRLSRNYQSTKIPPFRGSYQASIYMACYAALNGKDETFFEEEMKPSLFEVGRTGAFDITPNENDQNNNQNSNHGTIQYKHFFMLTPLMLLILLLSIIILSPKIRELLYISNLFEKKMRVYRIILLILFISIAVVFIIFGIYVVKDNENNDGEPFAFFEGISIWPTEMIRLLAVFLGVLFYFIAYLEIRDNSIRNDIRYGFRTIPRKGKHLTTSSKTGSDSGFMAAADAQKKRAHLFTRFIHSLKKGVFDTDVNEWNTQAGGSRDSSGTIEAREIWKDYLHRGRLTFRVLRIVPMSVVWVLFALVIIQIFGKPVVPHRGETSFHIDQIILVASIVMVVSLTYFVVDATRLCKMFIVKLSGGNTKWPDYPESLNSKKDICELYNIRLIASRTKVVGRLIVFPFVIIFLMVVCRSSYFDNWNWPFSLIIIIAGISLHAIGCAIYLRYVAENSRKLAIQRLEINLLESMKEDDAGSSRSKQIEKLIEMIQSIRDGAYAPLSQHPVLMAIFMPIGGIGSLALIELLVT